MRISSLAVRWLALKTGMLLSGALILKTFILDVEFEVSDEEKHNQKDSW